MQKFDKLLNWFDTHILEYLAYFLVVFIPLMPKLPLFDAIPGYIVRVRSEDIVIAITGLIWLIQFYRKKVTWKTPLTWVIAAYAVVGLLSTISAVIITKTVPAELLHIGKSMLHYFRYLEYFFLFFVVVTSIKTKQQLKVMYWLIVGTLVAIAIYGYGQRNFYWPVYSTMNREFSKGIRLVLTENARVQSTFGGHYDLAAYLVIVLPVILASLFVINSKFIRYSMVLVFTAGMWLMVQTSSRSSFLGFVIASYIVIGIFSLYRATWMKRVGNFIWHSTLYTILLIVMIFTLGQNMYDRFLQTIDAYPVLHDNYHNANKFRKEFLGNAGTYIVENVANSKQFADWLQKIKPTPPPNSIAIDPVMVASDTQPTPARPADITNDIPDIKKVATTSADGTVTITEIEVPRTWSADAQTYGLSAAIRYDTLWPRAIAGFMRNPVLGSGYATLTKEEVGHFTEAESTDNNFLRTLGETGALGFITFYGVVVIALKLAYDVLRRSKEHDLSRVFAISFIGGTIGLLVNAIYIDVFAASKVAFTFWALTGIITALYLQDLHATFQTDSFAARLATSGGFSKLEPQQKTVAPPRTSAATKSKSKSTKKRSR